MRRPERLEDRWLLTSDPIVTVDTNFGNFQIELRPDAAPNTVANFLSYVESGAYTDSIFHRSVPGFVEQAGGFTSSSATFSGSTSQFTTIPTNSPVNLEYKLANVAGSVAMARTSDPNSATDEWFVNLVDNTSTLGPASDGHGYTVFGQVIGNGMQVLDAIAALNVDNADNGGTFSQLPLGPNNELVRISSVSIDSIDGTVFSDTNGNGQLDSGEQGVAGRTMFVDLAGTGAYQSGDPTATTDSSGNYSFRGITPGTYKVYEELPTSISLTMPSQSVTVAANNTDSGVNFAEQPSIKGTVFTDTTGSGVLESGEAGVAGQTVFLNNDNSGAPDASNPSTVTDSNGNYSFSDLAAGTYKVDVVPPAGTTITTTSLSATVTAGGTAQTVNVGEEPASIAGTVFTDVNDNGSFDTGDIGIAGRTVFINQDNSGTNDGTNPHTTTNSVGQFTFSGLTAGSYTVMEALPTGATLTTPTQTVTVKTGQTTSGVVFGELPSISGNVFVDLNGSGQLATGDPGVGGQTVFLNIDHTGKPDTSNPSVTTDSSGNFAFGTEPPGSYQVEMQLPSNVTLSTSTQTVTVTSGKTTTAVDLGELPSITGEVFTDTNGNGALDSGETGISGRTVFLNIDGKGAPDNTNPSATTDANGHYYFVGLAPGSYPVTEVAPSGVTLSTKPQTVMVAAGKITPDVNIGEGSSSSGTTTTNTGTISGEVFDDVNLNGQLDSGETGVSGRTVFLNNDGTGVPDSGNPSTTTDSGGKYSFTGLAAGNYTVMEVVPPNNGVTLTTTAHAISLAAGGTTSGDNIGNALTSTILPIQVSTTDPPAASDANTTYINAVYQALLGHAPDPTGLSYWQQQMTAGASRATVTQGVWDSQEHRTDEVDQFYEEFLGRPFDSAGQSFWTAAFSAWGTEQIEVEGFLTSAEFLSKNQGNTAFVDALYNDLLQRSPTSSEAGYWEGLLNGGQTPLQVATAFVFGQEASTAVVDAFYSEFLHRAPGSSDLQMWVNDLTSRTMNAEQVGEQILASNEYYTDVSGNKAPTITSGSAASFTVGTDGSFAVTTSGTPKATLTESGSLPSGVTFTNNGDGTATLAGTPAAGSGGSYDLTITANNGVGTAATQSFVLAIDAAPTISSAAATTFTDGTAGTFTVSTAGTPTAALTESGSLPSGVTFTNNGDGTATLAGTPTATGSFPITIDAGNGISPDATQSFTLTVNAAAGTAPTISSANSAAFTRGTAGSFTVTTTGTPTPSITGTGLPSGVTLTNNGDGTATLASTASAAAGTYPFTITANNNVGTAATQQFTLTIS
ncbi:MAG TPA: SdrD B-like domain-containing protein [Pirellulales bacterium]|nr:SdrD B-like domain-containing protein [Pirellulales bacterium]